MVALVRDQARHGLARPHLGKDDAADQQDRRGRPARPTRQTRPARPMCDRTRHTCIWERGAKTTPVRTKDAHTPNNMKNVC